MKNKVAYFFIFFEKILAKIKIVLYNHNIKMGTIPNFERVIMKNYSRQREEIIKVVKELYTHPTAEEIYMIVKAKDPGVSRSTVYRNLGMLVENNLINKISMIVGPDRYDAIRECHNHAVCTKCGKVWDFDYNFEYEEIKKTIESQTGVEISNKGITLEGMCDSCKMNI